MLVFFLEVTGYRAFALEETFYRRKPKSQQLSAKEFNFLRDNKKRGRMSRSRYT